MTDNFEKDINIPSKEIIIKFSDGYCIVLENNEVSIRENVFTKFCIVLGKRTNELLEFVKELYLNKKAKEQALDEIEKIVKQTCSRRCTNDCLGTRKHCGYGQILDIINKAKEE